MSKVYRVYVEKKSAYAIEANELLNNIQTQLKIETVTDVHVVNRYDLQGVSEDVLKQGIPTILSEPMVDEIYQEDYPLNEHQKAFAIEFLPGQYDQRADACEQCFQVLTGEKNVKVKCAKLIVLEGQVSDDDVKDIQNYLNTLKNYSDSTIKKIKEQFSQAFKLAVNRGYTTRNPMDDVIRPKSTKKTREVRALEIDEQQKLTNYLMNVPVTDEPYKVAYLIEMYLGLRIGEVLALRNSDINLHKNLISISKTLTTDKNHKVIMGDSTKTYAGNREVPIPIFIRNEIINQMRLAENNKDKQLFLTPKGDYVRPNNANRKLKGLLEKMGITGITSHSLRHTYGTRCVEAGMRAVALQRLMGHTDVSITLNTYTSVFNKYKEAELEKVNNYYMNNEIVNVDSLLNENRKLLDNKEEREIE